jgi:hypothetical protein
VAAWPVRRLDFDGSMTDAIADTINRYKSSLRVIGSSRFNGRCDKSLEEHIEG